MKNSSALLKPVASISKKSQRMQAPEKFISALAKVQSINSLRGMDIMGIAQLSAPEILLILETAALLKANKFDETQTQFAKGQTLAMLFEKPSLRTRVTFEAGMTQLGGNAIFLEGKLGVREAVSDVASNLDRWVDGIMARTFDHQTIVELAANADIPVINGLSDLEHPCQALADFQTIKEQKGSFDGLKIAYVGDSNNVSNSLMLCAAKLGVDFVIGCPPAYSPVPAIWSKAVKAAKKTGAQISVVHDPIVAVADADVVYTDTWVSMGQESESAIREPIFAPYQVNKALLQHAQPDAIVMHCLPAHRGMEITSDVLDGPQSVVLEQAENRLHAQKAILTLVL
jgi:ornithine carbamoyltransferase